MMDAQWMKTGSKVECGDFVVLDENGCVVAVKLLPPHKQLFGVALEAAEAMQPIRVQISGTVKDGYTVR